MMSGTYGLLLDSMIVVLLVATIIYAAILNRRLAALRNNRSEMEQAARQFMDAASRADDSIRSLKANSESLGQEVRDQLARADDLRDEMRFLIEAGEAMAGRLEAAAGARNLRDKGAVGGSGSAGGTDAGGQSGDKPQPGGKGSSASHDRDAGIKPGKRGRRSGAGDDDLIRAIENIR